MVITQMHVDELKDLCDRLGMSPTLNAMFFNHLESIVHGLEMIPEQHESFLRDCAGMVEFILKRTVEQYPSDFALQASANAVSAKLHGSAELQSRIRKVFASMLGVALPPEYL